MKGLTRVLLDQQLRDRGLLRRAADLDLVGVLGELARLAPPRRPGAALDADLHHGGLDGGGRCAAVVPEKDRAERAQRRLLDLFLELLCVLEGPGAQVLLGERVKDVHGRVERELVLAPVPEPNPRVAIGRVHLEHLSDTPPARVEDRAPGLEGQQLGHLLPRRPEVGGTLGEAGGLLEDRVPRLVRPSLLAGVPEGHRQLAGVASRCQRCAEDDCGVGGTVRSDQRLRVLPSLTDQTTCTLLLAGELKGGKELIDRAAGRA